MTPLRISQDVSYVNYPIYEQGLLVVYDMTEVEMQRVVQFAYLDGYFDSLQRRPRGQALSREIQK